MPKPLLSEIMFLLDIDEEPENDRHISGVATDSRDVQEGQLFVAIEGQKVDGHSFVDEAASKGAIAALVRKGYKNQAVNIPLLEVDDPVTALQSIAKEHVANTNAKVVAVTGSIGKTTTKEFIHTMLKSKYRTAQTFGNQNSQVGMAASLINAVNGDEEFLVVEMGMTHAGHIQRLIEIVPPDIALVTYVALAHAVNFEDLEGIAEAKAEIFSHPKTELAIVNFDSPYTQFLLQKATCKKLTYSVQSLQADVKLRVEDEHMRVFERGKETKLPFVPLGAPHSYANCLAAATAAKACGMTWEEIGKALKELKLPEKRLQIVEKQGITFVNDSYNATEISMTAALSYVKTKHAKRRKIAVLGQMLELGKFSEICHRRVGEHALKCVDELFCLGQECAPIVHLWQDKERDVHWSHTFDDLLYNLKCTLQEGDLVLLKGSRANQLWQVLDAF